MRLLLYSWNANNEQVLADNLKKFGFELVIYDKPCKHYTRDLELASDMIPFIHAQNVEAVISFNYFPMLSMICSTCQIPYYAWVYDCPHFTLYAKQIMLPCNHIGIFDREMVKHLQEIYQVPTVFHAPLAADTEYFDRVIQAAQGMKSAQDENSAHGTDHVVDFESEQRDIGGRTLAQYTCDVSFVGSLYTDEHNYYDILGVAESGSVAESNSKAAGGSAEKGGSKSAGGSAEISGSMAAADSVTENGNATSASLDRVLTRQCFDYHRDYLRLSLVLGENDTSVIMNKMKEHGLMLGEDYFANPEDILLAAVLEKKVTVEERRILLTQIARMGISDFAQTDSGGRLRDFCFKLYTGSDTKKLPVLDACNQGTVDYHTQMPLVFASSRINLNISLRSIHSGIPLRVLDIMACGGFVLSNWQPELAEYFTEGEEITLFENKEECMEKIAYYLSHEEKRKEIAAAGKRKVQELFSYGRGLERLFGV